MKGASVRRNFLAVMSGSIIGQAIALVAAPVIARLFLPAEFGLLGVVSAGAIVLTNLMSLRADAAIPLPKGEAPAFALLLTGLVSGIVWTILLFISVRAFGSEIVDAFQPIPLDVLPALPLLAGSMVAYQVLNALAIRHRRFGAVGVRNVLQAAATALAQVAAGVWGLGAAGLVWGAVLGQLVGAASLAMSAGLRSDAARSGFTVSEIRYIRGRYGRLLATLIPSGLLNSVGLHAPILLIGALYGLAPAGWMALTQRVLALPVVLVGQAAAQVFLGELAAARRDGSGREHRIFWSASKRLAIVGGFAAGVIGLCGPAVFSFAFGETWRMSGNLAQIMAVALFVQFVASPVSQTLIVYERAGVQVTWDACRAIAVTSAVVCGWRLDMALENTVWLLSASSVLSYMVSWNLSRVTIANDSKRHRPVVARRGICE